LARRDITIDTDDGVARTSVFASDMGRGEAGRTDSRPGVILYMDGFGPRPALDTMADRLAAAGYVVLLPDLFYRFGEYGPYDTHTAFNDQKTRDEIMGMVQGTTQAMTERDGAAFLDGVMREGVDGRIGVVGYCMGGARAITAAAAYPDRVAAAASFHGGNLASEAADSPHRRAGTISGRVYVGSAGVDNSFPPDQSARLAEALRSAGVDHTIENYVGMAHGWAVPDHKAFNGAGAERHWKRLLAFFEEALR
jgi:carboxymethylenebutenolidase